MPSNPIKNTSNSHNHNLHKLNATYASLSNLSRTARPVSKHNHQTKSNAGNTDFQKFMLNNAQETENILLPDVYEKQKQTKSKIKLRNFFSEKVFTGSSIKYKVKSGSSSSINLIEEFPPNPHKHNVKTLSAKGTDLLVNNIYNKLSSKIV